MNDPCKIDPYTLNVDTDCQWNRAVTLWNAGLSGKAMTILLVVVLIGCTIALIRLAVDAWREAAPGIRRRQHARRALAHARRTHPSDWR